MTPFSASFIKLTASYLSHVSADEYWHLHRWLQETQLSTYIRLRVLIRLSRRVKSA